MKHLWLAVVLIFNVFQSISVSSVAGQSRVVARAGNVASSPGWVAGGVPVRRYFYAGPSYYYYAPGYYYQPSYPPLLVISPYSQGYVLPPTAVVSSPFFCLLHNEGFVSRVGLLDHLAGTHKIPLDATTALCPDGSGTCVFPSY